MQSGKHHHFLGLPPNAKAILLQEAPVRLHLTPLTQAMNSKGSESSHVLTVSVIITNYNYANFLAHSTKSVINQAVQPLEIIVVDDGSTDDSLRVLETIKSKTPSLIVLTQKNKGQLAAIRRGINAARGNWVFFLDADDIWKSNHLRDACAVINRDSKIGMYFSNHTESGGRPLFRSKWPHGKIGPCSGLVAHKGSRVGTIASTLGMKKEIALEALSFDCSIDQKWRMRGEDCLIFGATLSGAVAYYNSSETVVYRVHDNNSFASKDTTGAVAQYELKKEGVI